MIVIVVDGGGVVMRILMLAPQPFFEPRGAPFSVYHRNQALSALGHTVDLVTYPVGQDVTIPRVTIHRAWSIPGLKRVKVGPSLAKFPLDMLLFVKACQVLLRNKYDCIHTNQEAGLFGAILSKIFRIPHVFDMHADMAEELVNFKFTRRQSLVNVMRWVQTTALRSSTTVIAAYPELQEIVHRYAPSTRCVVIENMGAAAQEEEQQKSPLLEKEVVRLREEFGIPQGSGPVLVYTGTFEQYQGLDLLVQGIPQVLAQFPSAHYCIIGGLPEQVAVIQHMVDILAIGHAVTLPGRRPNGEMSAFMQLADILLSPRSTGSNTPLKLYSYLHAGKPILATSIRSHTQVLDSSISELVEPDVQAIVDGTCRLLSDPEFCDQLGRNAQEKAQRQYSYATFLALTEQVYDFTQVSVKFA